jgi:hypothetical protein
VLRFEECSAPAFDRPVSRSRPASLPVLVLRSLVCLPLACGGEPEADSRAPAADSAVPPAVAEIFTDSSAATGLDFVHFNGMSGEYYMAEILSPGGALVDLDNDGDLDVYLLQGHMLGTGKALEDALYPPRHPEPLTDRLYRNELEVSPDGQRTLRFTDVTEESIPQTTGYGVGVAAGDYDNDGRIDLYLANLRANQLLHNNGDGSFTDVTTEAGVGDSRWSAAAAFFDYDRDGWLDLFVGNYVAFPFDEPVSCRDVTGARDYCGPDSYPSIPDRLYHNRGDGSFEDVTERAGLSTFLGPALGVVTADLNGDGWPDIYVANDGHPNNLWLNRADGTFVDEALVGGCAVNASGKAEGSMGVDAADFDRDGDLDLFMTHLATETNTLFRNDGQGLFSDHTNAAGLAAPSRPHTAFGTGWLDYDNDGWLDLVAVNGAVRKLEALARANDPFPLHEPNQLFRNLGGSRFEEVSAQAGEAFIRSEVSRAAVLGDVDNDGDTDILLANNNGPARLLINSVGHRRHWLGLRLLSGEPPRDTPDARAALLREGKPAAWGRVRTAGGYGSANDPRILFGLGDDARVDGIRVHWLDGTVEEWTGVAVDRYTTLVKGTGRAR